MSQRGKYLPTLTESTETNKPGKFVRETSTDASLVVRGLDTSEICFLMASLNLHEMLRLKTFIEEMFIRGY